ncbi:WxcM-like domain-containing protein [Robertkochia solimangrovi]|uniref:WxcM-like domain-containing protein n=1 Tax=Robertkochia solimangrovi TaxID=2213046 RepID=UPI00117E7A07|nr:WxcM-like domain-containing protein [Robertkochia solimangrovi]TRZ45012.1 hypothetical protein DMZ48_04415 [Robertkochia solimangrovi]
MNSIKGKIHTDDRGTLRFFNDFPLDHIVRMYEIEPANTEDFRGWQGHLKEQKWMYCTSGKFTIKVVGITGNDLKDYTIPETFELQATTPVVLHIPGGNATAIRAESPGSRLLIFSDFSLEESKEDDYRYDINNWKTT